MGAAGPQRWEFARHALGVVACLVLGWFSIAQGLRIPLLADATYGFHALGHLMSWFMPEVYAAMMGSIFQVFIPLGLAAYFLLFHSDLLGVSLMLAWTGVSAHETGVYIADAPTGLIDLGFGHAVHDWALALGPNGLGRVDAAGELGWFVQALGLVFVLAGIGFATWGAARALMERPAVEQTQAYLERMPVRRGDDDSYPVEGLSDGGWQADSTARNWDPSGR